MHEMSDIVANLEAALSTQTTNLERIRGDQTLQIQLLQEELDKVHQRHQNTREQLSRVHAEATHAGEFKMHLERQFQEFQSDSTPAVTADRASTSGPVVLTQLNARTETHRVLKELQEEKQARKALEADVLSLRSTLSAKHMALQAAEEQRIQAVAKAESCQQTVDDLLIDNAHFSTQIEDAKQEIHLLKNTLDNSRGDLMERETHQKQHEKERQLLKIKAQELEQILSQETVQREHWRKELQNSFQDRDRLTERLQRVQEQLHQIQSNEHQRQRERTDSSDWAVVEQRRLADQINDLHKEIKGKDKAFENNSRLLKQTKIDIRQLRISLDGFQEALQLARQAKPSQLTRANQTDAAELRSHVSGANTVLERPKENQQAMLKADVVELHTLDHLTDPRRQQDDCTQIKYQSQAVQTFPTSNISSTTVGAECMRVECGTQTELGLLEQPPLPSMDLEQSKQLMEVSKCDIGISEIPMHDVPEIEQICNQPNTLTREYNLQLEAKKNVRERDQRVLGLFKTIRQQPKLLQDHVFRMQESMSKKRTVCMICANDGALSSNISELLLFQHRLEEGERKLKQLEKLQRTCYQQNRTISQTKNALVILQSKFGSLAEKSKHLQGHLRILKKLHLHERSLRKQYECRSSNRSTELLQADLALGNLRYALHHARAVGPIALRHSVELSIQTTEIGIDDVGRNVPQQTKSAGVQTSYVRQSLCLHLRC